MGQGQGLHCFKHRPVLHNANINSLCRVLFHYLYREPLFVRTYEEIQTDHLLYLREVRTRIFRIIIVLCLCSTFLASFYAYRQRAWADKLHAQLVQTNIDDVKIMHILTRDEQIAIARRFREQGETRIADWIETQYIDKH
jgi:hypothetical protein